MANFLRVIQRIAPRSFSTNSVLQVKQIVREQKGDELIIRGEIVPSPRENRVIENKHPTTCILCSTGIDLKHTDVLILSQFLRSDGCMLPKRVTGLCRKQQRKVSTLVTMAQKAGLMPNINPPKSKNDPERRFGWKKYNKYFDENTIKIK